MELDVHPAGMKMSFPGYIEWIPDLIHVDEDNLVIVNVSDGETFTLQIFNITVHRVTPEMFKVTMGPLLYIDGTAATGINVTITSPEAIEYANSTDENGNVMFFDVFPGEYNVTIEGHETDYYTHLTVDVHGFIECTLPKIALPPAVDDDDDIVDDDTDDDIADDDDDDAGINSDIIWVIATAVVFILAIAAVLIFLIFRKAPPPPEE